jgi:D-3-phosphoglycerate dehydrogenase
MMTAAGYSSIERLPKALGGDALREAVRGAHLIGIRSRTQIDAEILGAADRLIAIGRQWKG